MTTVPETPRPAWDLRHRWTGRFSFFAATRLPDQIRKRSCRNLPWNFWFFKRRHQSCRHQSRRRL